MDQYEYIRTAHRIYGKNISELARETGHSRNTVKKAIRNQPWSYKERKRQPFPALGAYLLNIKEWLTKDLDQPRKQRHTARRVYNRLKVEQGYQGSESSVRRYVRMARLELGLDPSCRAFIPCEPDAGREAEVDWGTATAVLAGEPIRLKFFCMRSKFSGKHFVRFYPCERQQAFFDAHIKAFEFFGGIFPILIYDNLSTAIRKVLQGKDRVEQEEFRKFKAFHNFESRFCNLNSGHEKGGVEGLVGFSRRNYMVPVPEATNMEIFSGNKYLAVHERLFGNNKWSLIPEHYLELIQRRPMSFHSARPIREWRKQWPESLHRLLSRFCRFQGETKGIKDFIAVLMLYSRYQPGEVEAAVELALEKNISVSEGVEHILIYSGETAVVTAPLSNWTRLQPPDLSVYAELGGVQ